MFAPHYPISDEVLVVGTCATPPQPGYYLLNHAGEFLAPVNAHAFEDGDEAIAASVGTSMTVVEVVASGSEA